MTNQSTHFSLFRLLQRLFALGFDEEKPQTEYSSQERSVPLKLAVFIDIENFGNSAAIRSVFDFWLKAGIPFAGALMASDCSGIGTSFVIWALFPSRSSTTRLARMQQTLHLSSTL